MVDFNPDRFHKRLRSARDDKGFSQSEAALASNFHPSAIAHFESGRRTPSVASLYRLCAALEVSADHLLGLEVEK